MIRLTKIQRMIVATIGCASAIILFVAYNSKESTLPHPSTASAEVGNSTVADNEFATAAELGLMEGFPPPPDKRVTRSEALLTPPYNRYSYLHMRMFYPTVDIAAADEGIPLKQAIDPEIANLTVNNPMTQVNVDMDTFFKESYTDSIVVIKGDEIVYEAYFNGMNPNQPHQMMSVTKSFAGLLGLMAIDEAKLEEDDQIMQYVPELEESSAFAGTTFGQVLDMTNSMEYTEDYADPESGVRRYGSSLGWTDPAPGVKVEDSLYDFLVTLNIDPDHSHGEIFHYQTPKTDVVNWVTNRVNNQSFQDAMYEKLWSKLGTEGDTYMLLDKNATPVAGGGLNATPYNLARFAMMMVNNGKFNGQQVVSPEIIQALSDGGSIEAFSNGPNAEYPYDKDEWSYRAMWWVRHTEGKEAFMAIGIHGQWIYIDVERNIAIVKQSSQPVSGDNPMEAYNLNAFDSIIAYLTKQ